jgi:hypothetical protein
MGRWSEGLDGGNGEEVRIRKEFDRWPVFALAWIQGCKRNLVEVGVGAEPSVQPRWAHTRVRPYKRDGVCGLLTEIIRYLG